MQLGDSAGAGHGPCVQVTRVRKPVSSNTNLDKKGAPMAHTLNEFIDPRAEPDAAMTANQVDELYSYDLPDGLVRMLSHLRRAHYGPQDVLYNEGQEIDTVFVVRHGLVKLVSHLPNGRARIVRLHSRGSVMGLSALIEKRYEHSAVAASEVDAYRIPISVLNQLKHEFPGDYAHLLEHWYDSLRRADTWITEFSTGNIRARVARLLAFLIKIEEVVNESEIELLTSDEMAAILGVTPESVSRVIAQFKRSQILRPVENSPHHVLVNDLDAIHQAAAG
jgi:CRP-like cAMP-binding protein